MFEPVPRPPEDFRRRAFTLIEILMVAALVVLLLVGLGAALRDNTGMALRTAQHLVAGLLGQARAAAATNQTESRLVIYATQPPTGDPRKFLRLLQVFRADPAIPTNWIPISQPVYLPRGVCLVPPAMDELLAGGVEWPANGIPISTLKGESHAAFPLGAAFEDADNVLSIRFGPDGAILPDASTDVILTVASMAGPPNRPRFDRPGTGRAVLLRTNGTIVYRNEPGDF